MPKKKSENTAVARSPLWIGIQVAFLLTNVMLILLSSAWYLGLIPDRTQAILMQRKLAAEYAAVTYSAALQRNDPAQATPVLEAMLKRTPDLKSMGVRTVDGKLLMQLGSHEATWKSSDGELSSDSEVKVPIAINEEPWGQVELSFPPLFSANPIEAFFQEDITRLFIFFSVFGILLFTLLVYRVLHGLLTMSSSEAIPKRIRNSFNTLVEGVIILDNDQKIVLANEMFAELCGKQPSELEGQPIDEFSWNWPENAPEGALYPWERSCKHHESSSSILLRLQAGSMTKPAPVSVNTTPIIGEDGSYRGTLLTIDNLSRIERKNNRMRQMIGELKRQRIEIKTKNKTLEFFATRDPLTGSLNRRSFFEQSEGYWAGAVRHNQPISCIMIDIDHFKKINDTHGHAMGDQAIKHLATLLESGKRASDLVGRYGGEEFVVLLPHVTLADAMKTAERMRTIVESTSKNTITFTISLGVASIEFGAVSVEAMLNQADQALYAAKHAGRNRAYSWDQLPEELRMQGDENLEVGHG
jgi:diguanylate cyclase (GGDEF)-like protein/PAS domain S-box-containing protein